MDWGRRAALISAICVLMAAGAPDAQAQQLLQHHWPGTSTADLVPGPTNAPAALYGSAAATPDGFSLSGGLVYFGTSAGNQGQSDFTVGMDIVPTAASLSGTVILLSKRSCSFTSPGFELALVDGHPRAQLWGTSGGSSTADHAVANAPGVSVAAGVPTRIAIVRHASELRISVNGKLVGTTGSTSTTPHISSEAGLMAGMGACGEGAYSGIIRDIRMAGIADGRGPIVVGDTPSAGAHHPQGTGSFDHRCTDSPPFSNESTSGLESCEFTVDGQPISVGAPLPSTPGVHAYAVSARDRLGNPTTNAFTYTAYKPVTLTGDAAFGDVRVGKDATRTVTITNTDANVPVTITGASGEIPAYSFEPLPAACTTLDPLESCQLTLRFAPDHPVTLDSNVSVSGTRAGESFFVMLLATGRGIGGKPQAAVSSLSFGDVAAGRPTTRSLTITNVGNGPMTAGADGDLFAPVAADAPGCVDIPVGGTCTVQITVTPPEEAPVQGYVTIADLDTGHTVSLAVSANGARASLSVPAGSRDLGDRLVGTTSAPEEIVLTNASGVEQRITASLAGTGFTLSQGTCAAPLPGHGTCKVSVAFSPTKVGAATATVRFASDVTDEVAEVAVRGDGTAPALSVAPASLDFGGRAIGSVTRADVLVANSGSAPLHLGTVALTGAEEFSLAGSACPAEIAPGAACSISIDFAPTALGARNASLQLPSDGGQKTVALSGAGSGDAPRLEVTPASLTFPQRLAGTASAPLSVHLHNATAGTTLHPVATLAAGPFALDASGCPAALAPGASCDLQVTFSPAAAGVFNGVLEIGSESGEVFVPLAGTGVAPRLAVVERLEFDAVRTGTATPSAPVSVRNTGSAPLHLGTPAIDGAHGGDFALDAGGCSAPIAPGEACTLAVTATPAADGARQAVLRLPSDAGPAAEIALAATGLPAPSVPVKPPPVYVTGPAPAAPPQQTVVVKPPAAVVLKTLPAPKCVSRRRLKVKVKLPDGLKAASVTFTVGSRTVKRITGEPTAVVDLKGLPRGSFSVTITVRTTDGQTIKQKRRYATCVGRGR